MASKGSRISDYIPQDEPVEYKAVQGYVPEKLRAKVIEKMAGERADGKKMNWDILLEACLKKYLDE